MRFTLRQLQAFTAVSRTQHFGRAAQLLDLSQPTVSGDVQALERALGVQLFTRSRAGTVLTSAGADLTPHANEVLQAADRLGRRAAHAAGGPDVVRLAATPSLVNRLVPETLQALDTRPELGVRVQVVEVPTGGVSAALTSGQADVGVGHFLDRPAGTKRGVIGSDELYVLAAVGRLHTEAPVALADLGIDQLLIWPREQNPAYFDAIMTACRTRGVQPQIVESATYLSGSSSYLLTSGQAFALVPADYARESSQRLSYAPLDPVGTIPLQAVWRVPPVAGAGKVLGVLRDLREE